MLNEEHSFRRNGFVTSCQPSTSVVDQTADGITLCFAQQQWDSSFSEYKPCESLRAALQCSVDLVQHLKTCFPESATLIILSNTLAVVENSTCSGARNNSTNLMKLTQNWTCKFRPNFIFQQCLSKISQIKSTDSGRFTFAECHDIQSSRDCFNHYALNCKASSIVGWLKFVYRTIIAGTPCDMPENINEK
ncbi:uncharacterized protein LOC129720964 isoform X2 [Wyeomyia smithii]|nr:uncharacterized protein LOC129720964 isoform X2 [Wyeomyia smithii]